MEWLVSSSHLTSAGGVPFTRPYLQGCPITLQREREDVEDLLELKGQQQIIKEGGDRRELHALDSVARRVRRWCSKAFTDKIWWGGWDGQLTAADLSSLCDEATENDLDLRRQTGKQQQQQQRQQQQQGQPLEQQKQQQQHEQKQLEQKQQE
ncbi:hypothetical protein, conserved [Eimeria tenella]|uniref:Uncharacterized protein n=1 Tax=Eimeria tenella TaxID=5802 RepID=U6KS53_EIMTE|nr:hypothetical protein, conserved [Eimeria tenella]CDJ38263.1 hypothetical protein, conserved [Eimeria tenella]|eukprot:XP_013229101.1 hypothetical protein, conserved [Eimeria tenella]